MRRILALALFMSLLVGSIAFADSAVFNVIGSGRQTVTTPGTAVALSSTSVGTARIIITALTGDTGTVCVGGSDVVAAPSTRKGIPLSAGQSIVLPVADLSMVYIDSTVASEGVSYTYMR